jgi:protein O-GlcNAc transferase
MNAAMIEEKFRLAVEHHQAGRLAPAEGLYREILQDQPRHAFSRFLLGRIALQQGDFDRARECIEQAIEIDDSNPSFHNDLGLVYQTLNRLDEAIASYERAVALGPEFYEANYNLGRIRFDQGRLTEAAELFEKAVAAQPALVQAWCQLGFIAGKLGKLDDALRHFLKALELQPHSVEVHHNLGNVYLDMGLPEEALDNYQRALAIQPDHRATHGNLVFTLLYLASSTPENILAAHRRYGELCEAQLKPSWPAHRNVRDPERRLRIGYVSPDFRWHSVACFIEPVLANHDKSAVEIHCYYTHHDRDATTERLSRLADHWIPCADLSDDALAQRIMDDGIDVLVDLAGRTQGNRLSVFARKPAPVQVSYLGYPATTGLSAIDYRLTTADLDPPGSEAWHTEQLYRLPTTLWCYRVPDDLPEIDPKPPVLSKGYVTFASMNTLAKVSTTTITAWAEILNAVPGARLLMTNVPEGVARKLLITRLGSRGIDARRLDLYSRIPRQEFLALTRDIDIVLDSFPYNGTTTTCEALSLGLPVVTVTGRTSVARSGHALLRSLSLPGLVARNVPEYVRIATDLARDTGRLAAVRRALPARFLSSPLRDEAILARDLEGAYRVMWRKWCAGGA